MRRSKMSREEKLAIRYRKYILNVIKKTPKGFLLKHQTILPKCKIVYLIKKFDGVVNFYEEPYGDVALYDP